MGNSNSNNTDNPDNNNSSIRKPYPEEKQEIISITLYSSKYDLILMFIEDKLNLLKYLSIMEYQQVLYNFDSEQEKSIKKLQKRNSILSKKNSVFKNKQQKDSIDSVDCNLSFCSGNKTSNITKYNSTNVIEMDTTKKLSQEDSTIIIRDRKKSKKFLKSKTYEKYYADDDEEDGFSDSDFSDDENNKSFNSSNNDSGNENEKDKKINNINDINDEDDENINNTTILQQDLYEYSNHLKVEQYLKFSKRKILRHFLVYHKIENDKPLQKLFMVFQDILFNNAYKSYCMYMKLYSKLYLSRRSIVNLKKLEFLAYAFIYTRNESNNNNNNSTSRNSIYLTGSVSSSSVIHKIKYFFYLFSNEDGFIANKNTHLSHFIFCLLKFPSIILVNSLIELSSKYKEFKEVSNNVRYKEIAVVYDERVLVKLTQEVLVLLFKGKNYIDLKEFKVNIVSFCDWILSPSGIRHYIEQYFQKVSIKQEGKMSVFNLN